MAVTTAIELCQLIEKSNILAAGPLERAKKFAESEVDAKSLARTLIEQKLLTSWQARQLMAGVAGLRMGKYVLLDELGRGDLGRVYLAEHTQLVRRAALKLLSRELCENKDLLRRFLGEARLIASLDHPNVVHTLDVSSESDRYYVVFEYVVGRDLTKLVAEQGRLTAAAAAELILQVAEGMAHAHEKGVVHADLKPGNLMVDAQGHVKILDIGVDRLGISLQAANSAAGRPATTPSLFRAPELARGDEALTPQSDLFSLGMIFVFLVTGENPPPPDADLGQTQSDAILSQLSVACPDLPEELAQLCGKLTAERPEDRLDSVASLRDTLRDWLADHTEATTAVEAAATAAREAAEAETEAAAATSEEELDFASSEPAPVVKIIPSKGSVGAKGSRPVAAKPTAASPSKTAAALTSTSGTVQSATPAAVTKPSQPLKATATKPTAGATPGAATAASVSKPAATRPTAASSTPASAVADDTAATAKSAGTAAAGAAAVGAAAAGATGVKPKAAPAATATGTPAKPTTGAAAAKASGASPVGAKGPAASPSPAAGAGAKTTSVSGKPSPAGKPTAGPTAAASAAAGAASKTIKKPASADSGSNSGSDSGTESLDPLGEAAPSSFLAEAESDSAVAESGVETSLSFTVKTGGKRPAGKGGKPAVKAKAKPSSSVVANAAAVAEEGGEEAAKPQRKIPLWVWIAGGSGVAGVTLIVLIIAMVVMIFGGSKKSDQVAQSGGPQATGTGATGTEATGNGAGETGTGAGGAETAAAGAATGVAGDGAGTPAGADPANGATGGVDPVTGSPVAGVPVAGGAGAPGAGAAPGTAPATPPPTGTPAGAAPDPLAILLGGGNAPSATPGTTPPADPAAVKPETPSPNPASGTPNPMPNPMPKPTPMPPPPAPKPAPKPVGDPLKDFPKEFIELPALAKDGPAPAPVSLGKITLDPKALPSIYLLGGDGAIKGKSRFVMESSDGGTAERDWDIFLREGDAESGGVKVAHLALKESDLIFAWEADAGQHLASPHLINCMLQIAAGPKQATVALRKPLEVEPLKAEILKGMIKGKFDVPFPPNSDRMKVDIVFDGPFPPLKFEGQNPMDADKGKATVWFGASQETQVFALRLDTALRRQLEVGFDPHVRINPTGKPEKLTAVGLGKMQKQAQAVRQQSFAMLEMTKKATAGKNDETTQQRLSLMESQLTGITKASEQLEGLKGMAEQLLQGGRIHVRVFCQVDDFKLELVRTAGIPAGGQK